MSLGKPCYRHTIPENICVACRGAAEERNYIITLLDAYCDSNHSALDSCECGILADLIKLGRGDA
jgi:hypothetical protein